MSNAAAGLRARVVVRRGRLDLDVDVAAGGGEVVAVLGPNGAGKSTLLHAVAGLVPLQEGRVVVGDTVWEEVAPGGGTRLRLPPEDRAVGLVPQDLLLFPHLSVLDNTAFGPRARGVGTRQARRQAYEELERWGVASLAGERPRRLSGGQAQRVALARGLAADPAVLLLDEPLSALDARTRVEVRSALRERLRTTSAPTLLVTHEPLDAMVLGDRIVVVEDGTVVQAGTPVEVARRPRTDYVARLMGLNLLPGDAQGGAVRLASGAVVVAPGADDGPVLVAFRPSAVGLHSAPPGSGSARNVWPGRVRAVEPHGSLVRVEIDGPVPLLADVTAVAVAELELGPGRSVWASVKAAEVSAYRA